MKKLPDKVKEPVFVYEKRNPTLIVRGSLISLILAKDENKICAFCPELDIITEMPSEDEALCDMLEALRDYAVEYKGNFRQYHNSPNRAHHWPYIKAILKTKDAWELRRLLDIRYGDITHSMISERSQKHSVLKNSAFASMKLGEKS